MLSYRLLKNHAGILLIGDYLSLRSLHEIIHDVNERSPLIVDREGAFLGLAYDVRKAFEQQREIIKSVKEYPEVGIRFGVQILWPVLLVHARLLRVSLAYLDHSYKHQAAMYALEAVIEEALNEDFPAISLEAKRLWLDINPEQPIIFEQLDSRGAYFCSLNKTARKQQFLNLLRSFDPMYDSFYALRLQNNEKALVSPSEFALWQGREWPDPKW